MSEEKQITEQVARLKGYWNPRESAFKKWYKIIQLFNDLAQPRMESVISSDPRTGFNMALWLLRPKTFNYEVDTLGFSTEAVSQVGLLQNYADKQMRQSIRRSRAGLWGDVLSQLLKFMLATGWYSFFSMPTESGWFTRVLNPASVFPEYDEEGQLVRVGRRYSLSHEETLKKITMQGWGVKGIHPGNHVISGLWEMREGIPYHGVTVSGKLAKPMTPSLGLRRIPIFTAPVAGLPDDGNIIGGASWKASVGESVIAPIAGMQKNLDKMMTYMQQILRDTANPKWVEETSGPGVVNPEKLYERGALFRLNVGDKLYALQSPPLPAEMRSHQFDVRSQIQRGLFSDAAFGDSSAQLGSFAMSQVIASSMQILDPFQTGLSFALSEMGQTNLQIMRDLNMELDGEPFPSDIPDDFSLDFKYEIQIPGDFLQRANSARLLNPEFRLSSEDLVNQLFPEIRSAALLESRLITEDARRDPAFRTVLAMRDYTIAAREAREVNDLEMADWLEQLVDIKERQLNQATGQPALGEGQTDALTDLLEVQ